MRENLQTARYLICDILASMISWTLFYIFRKIYIESFKFGVDIPLEFNNKYFLGLLIIPAFWVLFYYLTGYYRDALRKSRLNEITQTFLQTLTGVLILFFLLILDDVIHTYRNYYLLFSALFLFHFVLTLIPRLLITSAIIRNIRKGKIRFNTLLIGGGNPAVEIFHELQTQKAPCGNHFVGFIDYPSLESYPIQKYLPNLGTMDDIGEIIKEYAVEEVIIALETKENNGISNIINKLGVYKIVLKAIPNMYDILTGKVKMTTLFGTPLIQLSHDLMPVWQKNIKHLLDYIIAAVVLLISLPIIIFLMIGIKVSSPGPIFYSHERIGRYGKPFRIYKFRSMRIDAEINGPELSSRNDTRLTRLGRFMRKYRFDEIPNFFNVLKGDMSLVGPRPERQYYIDQIIQRAPHFIHLQKVKPGITSWGQVKYGYAENVDQMILRLKYDILYIENMSLYVDLRIILYTILTIFRGRGV
jgi:exopolysaccharide biosynthesis polyprenyl glycosylphosphotransferase